MPACVYTPIGLAEFMAARQVVSEPQTGDVAFYCFSTKQTDVFSMPHAGIVVDVAGWKKYRRFQSVEGGVDGSVVMVVRSSDDVIAFARPDFGLRPGIENSKMQTGPVFVDSSRVKPGSSGRDVMNVQLALERVVGLREYTPAVFDAVSQRAFARWQRMVGHVGSDLNGVPTPGTLSSLGEISGVYTTNREASDENQN